MKRVLIIFIPVWIFLISCISNHKMEYPVRFPPLAPDTSISGLYHNGGKGNKYQSQTLYEYLFTLYFQIGQDGTIKREIVKESFLNNHIRNREYIVHIKEGSGKVTVTLKKDDSVVHSISLKSSLSRRGIPLIHTTSIQHGELVTHTENQLMRDSTGALIIKAIHTSKGHCFCLPVITGRQKQVSWFRWDSAK